MGFPLLTDIFGQLKWLVKQVKLLVYRVTKIENGGGPGAQTIQQVLATGNESQGLNLIVSTDPNTIGNKSIGLQADGQAPINVNVIDFDNETFSKLTADNLEFKGLYDNNSYSKTYVDQLEFVNLTLWNSGIINNSTYDNVPIIYFYNNQTSKTQNILANKNNNYDNNFILPYSNTGSYHLALQEVPPSNDIVNIDLSTGNKTPNLSNQMGQCCFNILVGSVTNKIVLNDTFNDYCTYTFFNETTPVTFMTNTGGTIFGNYTSLTAGLILVTKRGNDFFINR